MKKIRGVTYLLMFLMMFYSIPMSVMAVSNVVPLSLTVRSDQGILAKGQKGVDYDLSYIYMTFDDSFVPMSGKQSGIQIGSYKNGIYTNENEKFEINVVNGAVTFTLKKNAPIQDQYQLRKHTLYSLHIPQGTFKNGSGQVNEEIHYTFVTQGEDSNVYKKDILTEIKYVYTDESGKDIAEQLVDKETGIVKTNVTHQTKKIIFEFVNNIGMDIDVRNNIGNYIEISTKPMDSRIPGYQIAPFYEYSDSITNYNVITKENQLILEPKGHLLKDMAEYTIKLKNNTIYLQNSPDIRIYNQDESNNDFETVEFYTDDMVKRTYPKNNQEGVEVEPTIEFEFKYPVQILDKTKVKISSDGLDFALDQDDIYLTTKPGEEDTTLLLNIDDHEKNKVYPLRKNTLYKVTIEQGALRFRDYFDSLRGKAIENHNIYLYFITREEGESPIPIGYSSDINMSDDIRYFDHEDKETIESEDNKTNLDITGSIYIKFNKDIQQDKQSEYLSLLGAAKLYKMPKAEKRRYDSTGQLYDEILGFYPSGIKDVEGKEIVIPSATSVLDSTKTGKEKDEENYKKMENEPTYMEEIAIEKVEILSPDILKITPKYPLEYITKYKLTVDRRVIEDTNGYNLEKDIDIDFWTKASDKKAEVKWRDPKESLAEDLKENNHSMINNILYGLPEYGQDNPIRLELDGEVILKVKDRIFQQTPNDPQNIRYISYDELNEITLTDVYTTNDADRNIPFKKFEFRYFFDGSNKKTKVYLYPSQALKNGKQYQLMIPEGTMITRSNDKVDALQIDFVVEGDHTQPNEAYRLENNVVKVTDLWEKGEWDFTIYGSNFHENIDKIELTNDIKPTVSIDSKDIEFKSVTELKVKIREEHAKYFSKEAFVGSYKITIYYDDGTSTQIGSGNFIERDIEVNGKDFREDIKEVVMKQKGGSTEITLETSEVEYINSSKMVLKIRGDKGKILYNNTGEYDIIIHYESNIPFGSTLNRWTFELYGENFDRAIEQVILKPISGDALLLSESERNIVIETDDIDSIGDSKLVLDLSEENQDKMEEKKHAGTYEVIVKFAAGQGIADFKSNLSMVIADDYGVMVKETVEATKQTVDKVYVPNTLLFTVLSKGSPKVLSCYPESTNGTPLFDEKKLAVHEVQDEMTANRQFLKVTFEDIDGTLSFNYGKGVDLLLDTTIQAVGGNSVLDKGFLNTMNGNQTYIDKYLFIKDRSNREAYLYIPVKGLKSQTEYQVTIQQGIVKNDAATPENSLISWAFITMSQPSLKEDDILIQTVVEDYDEDEPIIIKGNFFYTPSINVYFGDEEAEKVISKVDTDGKIYLEVYLPDGRDRLEPGLYDIVIQNDENHEEMIYGSLSVVKEGDFIPTEEYKVKKEEREGEVHGQIKVSEDILMLESKYADDHELELDLDELMGEEVLVRTIQYEGDDSDTIDELITKSKWVDITLYNVTLDLLAEDDEITIQLGRIEPTVSQMLRKKLQNRIAKSQFIQVSGNNFRVEQIYAVIPYENSDGINLKALRYDEQTRKWYTEVSRVDYVNQTVTVTSSKPGIFVIVE